MVDNVMKFSGDGEYLFREKDAALKLIAVGDVIPSGRVEDRFISGEVAGVFGNTGTIFLESDFVLYNLETPLCSKGDPIAKCGANFKTGPGVVNGLKKMNFLIAALANNHIMDHGEEGLTQTLEVLDQAGIMRHGAGMTMQEAAIPLDVEKKGIKIRFLNFAEGEFSKAGPSGGGAAIFDPLANKKDIETARNDSDIVVVSVHAGKEFQHFPSPRIQALYRGFVDCGADLVIGHHPHIPQGFEHYCNSLIAYSFGDFLFEYGMDPGTCATMALEIGLDDAGVTAIKIYPIRKNPDASLVLMEDRERQVFIDHINRISHPLKDANELRMLYEQGVLRHFDYFYVYNLVRHANRINGPEIKRKPAAEFLYNMLDCPAHREALKTAFQMMYDGRCGKNENVQAYLGSLYHCLETLGFHESLEPWKPPRSFLQRLRGRLSRIWQ